MQSEIPNELACEKVSLLGCDSQGRAVVLFLARKHNAWTRNLEELERLVCYVLDAAIKTCDHSINPARKITVFLDLTELGTVSLDVPAVKGQYREIGILKIIFSIIYQTCSIAWFLHALPQHSSSF